MDEALLRAQHGEDRLLADRFAGRRRGYFVEVGALDGDELSNTFYFEKALGWTGVLVEANPVQAASCRRNRPESHVAGVAAVAPGQEGTVVLEVADGHAGFSTLSASRTYHRILQERGISTTPVEVPATTLDSVLEQAGARAIDFVTIDVEGHERAVLAGFDLRRWRPEVILLESASGAPDPRISWTLFRAGYARVRRVVVNDWYEARPLPARVGRLVAAYVVSLPVMARILAREALRALGLLEPLRRRRHGR
ncbi:FkbM family methyltransferase [Aeromicrobium sp. CF4.19]|uniref:FkbM family methyltransferase n=1 Tax=Aeromicrobium sp. CF4.19 TaxID=3373082 RepID=UPI003EE6B268